MVASPFLSLEKLTDYTKPMSLLDFKRSVAIGHLTLGVRDKIRFSGVGVHMPIFVEKSANGARPIGGLPKGRVLNPGRF